MTHHVVIYSGGMDSFTLLNKVRAEMKLTDKLHTLSFNYGQRHKKELGYAIDYTLANGIDHEIIDLRTVTPFLKGSALTDAIAVPEGHYAAESMRQTVVPGRNTMMLSIALAYAEGLINRTSQNAILYYGAHAGDHFIYPDCRPEYIAAMQEAIRLGSGDRVTLETPFYNIDKTAILTLGLAMGLDYGQSWTCYKGLDKPCGVCGSCNERAEAFALNNAIDPLLSP